MREYDDDAPGFLHDNGREIAGREPSPQGYGPATEKLGVTVLVRTALSERTPRIDRMAPEPLEAAMFSMGCFKGSEARLGLIKGVWKTCVGYAGGVFPTPTYDDIRDHIETVRVEYDPQTVSYGQLLELFLCWYCTSPLDAAPRRAPHIFVRSAKEHRLAQAAVDRSILCGRGYPRARIVPFKTFYPAEAECQKHYLRRVSWLFEELLALYGTEEDLLQSTLAARLNAFLSLPVISPPRPLPEDIELYGLPPHALRELQHMGV